MVSWVLPPLPNWELLEGRNGIRLAPEGSPAVGTQPVLREPSPEHLGQLQSRLMPFQVPAAKGQRGLLHFHTP